jgi:hypothetical protein
LHSQHPVEMRKFHLALQPKGDETFSIIYYILMWIMLKVFLFENIVIMLDYWLIRRYKQVWLMVRQLHLMKF